MPNRVHKMSKFEFHRREAGLSRVQVAKLCGTSIATIGKWERGRSYPRADVLFSLANLYECEAHDLLDIPTSGRDYPCHQ